MKKALSSACDANESSFEKIDLTNNEGRAITSATYQGSKVWCMYQAAGTTNKIYISRRDRDPK